VSAPDAVARRLGAEVLGPLLGAMAGWVQERARERGVDRLYFLGRDGWLFHRAMETLGLPAEPPGKDLLSSRRCWGLAAVRAFDQDGYRWFGTGLQRRAVREWFERCDIVYDPEACRPGEVEPDTVFDLSDPVQNDRFRAVVFAHAPAIEARARKERAALLAYLRAEGVDAPGTVGLVDVGWRGTAQVNLASILQWPPERIVGFYWGVHRADPQFEGLWYAGVQPGADLRTRPAAVFLMDCLFARPEPTLLRFELDEGGQAVPVTVHPEADVAIHAAMAPAQAAALAWLRDAGIGGWRERAAAASRGLAALLDRPCRAEVRFLRSLPYRQGQGADAALEPLAAAPAGWRAFLPSAWRRPFHEARWPEGLAAMAPAPLRWWLRRRIRRNRRLEEAG